MIVRLIAGAAAISLAAPAAAQTMNAEEFHRRATALQKKRAMAVFSMGKVKALSAEARAAGRKAREVRLAAIAARKPPRYCPPEGLQSMNSSEFMERLSQIPAAERARIDMTEATVRILARKHPCRS